MLYLYWFSVLPGSTIHVFTCTEYQHLTSPCLCKRVTWTYWMDIHNGFYWIVSGFLSRLCLPPSVWVFRFLEVVLWCMLINTGGFPLPSLSLQFPLCVWNSNSTTNLCLCCIYSYAPLKGLLYLFIWAGRGWHACQRSDFGESFLEFLQALLREEQLLQHRDFFFLSFLPFPTSWCITIQLFSICHRVFTGETSSEHLQQKKGPLSFVLMLLIPKLVWQVS